MIVCYTKRTPNFRALESRLQPDPLNPTGRFAQARLHSVCFPQFPPQCNCGGSMSYYRVLDRQVYAYEEVARWLESAGSGNVRRVNLLRVVGNSLIIGAPSSALSSSRGN